METDVQDLLQEKDTHIATLEQERQMARARMLQVEDAIADERERSAVLEEQNRDYESEFLPVFLQPSSSGAPTWSVLWLTLLRRTMHLRHSEHWYAVA